MAGGRPQSLGVRCGPRWLRWHQPQSRCRVRPARHVVPGQLSTAVQQDTTWRPGMVGRAGGDGGGSARAHGRLCSPPPVPCPLHTRVPRDGSRCGEEQLTFSTVEFGCSRVLGRACVQRLEPGGCNFRRSWRSRSRQAEPAWSFFSQTWTCRMRATHHAAESGHRKRQARAESRLGAPLVRYPCH